MSSPEEEARLVEEKVDTHDWGPSEPDEEDVLQELYGPPNADGVYGVPRREDES